MGLNQRPSSEGIETQRDDPSQVHVGGVSISALAQKGLKPSSAEWGGPWRSGRLNQRPSSEGIETGFLFPIWTTKETGLNQRPSSEGIETGCLVGGHHEYSVGSQSAP